MGKIFFFQNDFACFPPGVQRLRWLLQEMGLSLSVCVCVCVRSLLVLAARKSSLVKVGCLRVLQECIRLDVCLCFDTAEAIGENSLKKRFKEII